MLVPFGAGFHIACVRVFGDTFRAGSWKPAFFVVVGGEDSVKIFDNHINDIELEMQGNLIVCRYTDFSHTAEREQFRTCCKILKDLANRTGKSYAIIANYNTYDIELDALVIKNDGIIAIEFKNYGGQIVAVENGDWTADGKKINGGSGKTVYKQALINHVSLRKGLDSHSLKKEWTKYNPTIIVFNKDIEIDNKLGPKAQGWLHITDNKHFNEKIADVTCPGTYISDEEIVELLIRLGITDEWIVIELSSGKIVDILTNNRQSDSSNLPDEGNSNNENEPITTNSSDSKICIGEVDKGNQRESRRTEIENESEEIIAIPQWLDKYLFLTLKAEYKPQNTNITVIDWNKDQMRTYLGTYFPRSYAESYQISKKLISENYNKWKLKDEISVFDFGCGTGGELIGFIMAIKDSDINPISISITGLDGNKWALKNFESIVHICATNTGFNLNVKINNLHIEDLDDLSVLNDNLTDEFDIILSFKAICEIISKELFAKDNAYKKVVQFLLPLLKKNGLLILADISSQDNISREWLPNLMDNGLRQLDCDVINKNDSYNQAFYVKHSRCQQDKSKIVWRVIQK